MVWPALKEAPANKLDLATIWLDVAIAFPLILHRLIFFALERYLLEITSKVFIVNHFLFYHQVAGTGEFLLAVLFPLSCFSLVLLSSFLRMFFFPLLEPYILT